MDEEQEEEKKKELLEERKRTSRKVCVKMMFSPLENQNLLHSMLCSLSHHCEIVQHDRGDLPPPQAISVVKKLCKCGGSENPKSCLWRRLKADSMSGLAFFVVVYKSTNVFDFYLLYILVG